MARQSTLQTQNLTTSPSASLIFTLPAGHNIAEIVVAGVTTSVSTELFIAVGKGGSFPNGTEAQSTIHQSASSRDLTTLGRVGGDDATKYGYATLYGMQTACPILLECSDLDSTNDTVDSRFSVSQRQGADDAGINQIRIVPASGTMNGGFIYCISYRRKATVQSQVLSAASSAVFTGFTQSNASMLMVVSDDMALSASGNITFETSTDGGSSWLGAGSWRRPFRQHNLAGTQDIGPVNIGGGANTDYAFGAIVWGMPIASQYSTMVMAASFVTTGSVASATHNLAQRLAGTAENAVRLAPSTGTATGTAYAVGFAA